MVGTQHLAGWHTAMTFVVQARVASMRGLGLEHACSMLFGSQPECRRWPRLTLHGGMQSQCDFDRSICQQVCAARHSQPSHFTFKWPWHQNQDSKVG